MKFLFLAACLILLELIESFQVTFPQGAVTQRQFVERRMKSSASSGTQLLRLLLLAKKEANDDEQEYRNAATKVLSNFLAKEEKGAQEENPLAAIDFDAPKLTKLPIETLAQALDAELYASEWFVTGRVNPVYFADTFKFQDPDVKLTGIQEYAAGVYKLFDQATARAEIISTAVSKNKKNTITCTWRLSGKVNIGPGLTIKPYIVFTDFTVDPDTGLIVFQEDRFDLPQWDILLSALFPFLIGTVTAPPAPAPEPRDPPPAMPKLLREGGRGTTLTSPFDALKAVFSGIGKKEKQA